MDSAQFITGIFIRISEVLETALDGLTQDEINRQPDPGCNSISWMVWHLTRVQDMFIARLSGNEQVWIAEKWYEQFGREADPRDAGHGHQPEDLAIFNVAGHENTLGLPLRGFREDKAIYQQVVRGRIGACHR